MLVSLKLIQAKSNGIRKTILFSEYPAAEKAFIAIGFQKVGDFRFAIFEKPFELDNKRM